MLLAVQNQREWRRLCEEVLEAPELVDDPRFATNPARVAHRDKLESIVTATVADMSAAEFERRLDKASIGNARMNDVEQLWHHPVLRERRRWREIRSPGGVIDTLIPPVTFAGGEPTPGDVPALGAHSAAILCELGYSDREIERLRAAGVTT